jgi:uncharacterized YigZ family protein
VHKQIKNRESYQEIIKDSKFLGFCFPVKNVTEARSIIRRFESDYRKATHVCWAFRVFQQNDVLEYNSDAGEPGGSAGPPIQKVLAGRGLVNTLCLVVRYFGGTKLGIGGLMRAYSGVAGKTLDRAGTENFIEKMNIRFRIPLTCYPAVIRLLQIGKHNFQQSFGTEDAVFSVEVPRRDAQELKAALAPIQELVYLNHKNAEIN